ncbi:MAG: condensation domain-containing protein, partial [Melioribacteraceae bacterium]|nr:condensation domain-containing protein [Melioribacteraceae bacterium]
FTSLYNSYKNGIEPSLRNLEIQYSDYANWQKNLFQNHYFDRQVEYWKNQLASLPEQLNLPTDFPRPPLQTYNGDRVIKNIDRKIFNKIDEFSKNYNVTKFLFLYTSFNVLLYKYSNETDIFIGTPVNGRTREEFEPLIGMFVNTLVLRSEIIGNTKFEDLLDDVKEKIFEAFANQDVPFQKLVDILQPQRNLSFPPLFQHMFVYNISEVENVKINNVEMEQINIENKTAKYDLTFEAIERAGSYTFIVEYNTDLYRRSTIENFIDFYCNILEQALENKTKDIDKFSLIQKKEQSAIASYINNPPKMRGIENIFPIEFNKVADLYLKKTAIEINDKSYSFEILQRESNKIANHLLNRGIQSDEIVGLCLHRSFELISSLIGILKSGAAYLPFEPLHPKERINFIINDSGAKYIVTESRYQYLFNTEDVELILIDKNADDIDSESDQLLDIEIDPSNLSYVIYTSGSTGRPKGTLITHAGLKNYLSWTLNAYPIHSEYGSVVISTLSFDATVTSIFPSLLVGKKILLTEENDEINQLVDHVHSGKKFSILKITPAHTQMLASIIDEKRANEIADAF